MSRAEAVIQASGLVKRYGQVEAVRGIDLEVRHGEIFGFLGPNGAGKSTTISILCTLLVPSAGTAKVAGIDVVQDPARVRQRIGLVFQDPSLDDVLTGRENLEFHAWLYGVPTSERRKRLDELRDTKGITIFMTTHYMDEAEYCDRIAIIDRGKIVALGTPDELKAMVGGDVVTITSSKSDDAAAEIEKLLGVTPVRDNGSLRMEVPDAKVFVPRLVRELTAPVDTVTLRRPSLDDVFLKLTGHAIRDEEAGTKDQMRAMASRWMGRRR